MKLSADRSGNIRHFSAKLGWKESFDSKEIELLSAGAVPMLIPPSTVQGRKNNIIQYDISAYSTLEFYLSCILSREQFADLLLQCLEVFQRMQKICLNYKNLVLDLDKIYIQLNDRTIHFIYLPLMNSKREASLQNFFRLLVTRALRSTYEQSNFLDACFMWLNRPSAFVLGEFEKFIRDNSGIDAATAVCKEMNSKPDQPMGLQPECFVSPMPKEEWGLGMSTSTQGDTVPLNVSESATVLLGESEPPKPKVRFYLLRIQPEEKVGITHFPFLVGTELGTVDYRVSDNSAVSRRHAEFSLQEGECVISDQKATNKTYVNDCVLTPFMPQPLKNGDVIRLGNEQFKFIREELF